MKKLATILMLLIVSANLLKSQTTGGPDAYGYIWRNNFDANGPVYNWIDILPLTGAQNVRFLGDDNTVGSFPIGFPFHYYWYDVSQFWVGSNGYIGFSNGQISSPFPAIPNTLAPQNFVAAMASDLIFGAPSDTAQCWRWTNAAADTLIVSYIGVPFYATGNPGWTGSNTFQIILSAVDSSITFQYKQQVGFTLTTAGNIISVGIENNSGQIGLQQSLNTYPGANYAVKFTYPSNTTYMVSDASTTYNNNSETGGLFISNNTPTPFVMNTSIKNTGNQNLAAFNVFSRVTDNSGSVQTPASATVVSNALTPGQTQNITIPQPNVFSPVLPGTYKYISSTQLTGDLTPSNDTKMQELVVVDTTLSTIRLSFDRNVPGVVGLNWTGGQGGGGMYFIPPFYPCKITQLHSFITTNDSLAAFSMMVYQDNGPGGTPGSMLDSEFVSAGSVATHSWNTAVPAVPIVVNSGGVYVAWSMDGPGITLGLDTVGPFSNRTFEVISGTWAIYRSREVQDLMINISIQKTINAGISENELDGNFGQFYPNPSYDLSTLDFSLMGVATKLVYDIYDVEGKLVTSKNMSSGINGGKLVVNTVDLSAGIYTCKINVDGNTVVRKLVIVR